jgi:ATP-binding protein involved in chromosome partitioning
VEFVILCGVMKNIKKIIGIAAGKGGVGKSTVTVNLALALKECGFSVGILDADIYGPSLLKMLEIDAPPTEGDGGIIPGKSHGIACMSMAFFNVGATIVRAPIANQVMHQFVHGVMWGN